MPETQPIWICGDCHVENLGALAGYGGEVAVQIRDFDQTVVGHPGHDLLRLCLSLASAARSSDLPGTVTAQMVEAVVRNYALALARGRRDEIPTAPKLIEATQRCAFDRTWKHLAKDRLKHRRPTIDHGKKFWPLAPEEHASIVAMFAQPAMRDLVLKLHRRDSEAEIEVVDAAYWVKGCSSLELLRYAAIIGIHDGSGEPRYALFDIKEAEASVAPAARPDAMPNDPAERVVAGARALSPILGERMAAGRIMDRPVFVRELLPQDLKIEVDQFASKPPWRSLAISLTSWATATPTSWGPRRVRHGVRRSAAGAPGRSMRRIGCGTASWRWPDATRRDTSTIAASMISSTDTDGGPRDPGAVPSPEVQHDPSRSRPDHLAGPQLSRFEAGLNEPTLLVHGHELCVALTKVVQVVGIGHVPLGCRLDEVGVTAQFPQARREALDLGDARQHIEHPSEDEHGPGGVLPDHVEHGVAQSVIIVTGWMRTTRPFAYDRARREVARRDPAQGVAEMVDDAAGRERVVDPGRQGADGDLDQLPDRVFKVLERGGSAPEGDRVRDGLVGALDARGQERDGEAVGT